MAIKAQGTLLGIANKTFTVTGATNATPIVITATGHTFSNGQTTYISGVEGNTAANGKFTISGVVANQFTLDGSVGNGVFADTDGNARAEQFTTIAEVTNITPGPALDELDYTNHSSPSGWRQFLGGLVSKELTLEANYIPTNATHNVNTTTGLLNYFKQGTTRGFLLTFPDAGATLFSFIAMVRSISHNAPVDGLLSFTTDLRIVGSPNLQ